MHKKMGLGVAQYMGTGEYYGVRHQGKTDVLGYIYDISHNAEVI